MAATALDECFLAAQVGEEGTGGGVSPDLRKGRLQDVADGVVAPELVWIDRTVPGNTADALARRVAAVEGQKFERLVRVGMVLGFHPEVEGDAVAGVVDGEDLHGEAGFEARARFGEDRVERGTGLGVVEVRRGDLPPSPRVDEMVEADARHAFAAHEVEDGGEGGDVVAGHRHAQADLDAPVAEAADGCKGLTVGAGVAAEGVVNRLGAVDGNADVGDAEVADPVRPGIVDERAVRREGDADATGLRVGGERADVRAEEGFAAGEEDDGDAEGGEIVDHGAGLVRREHALLARACGVAVRTGEIAGGGAVPHHHGAAVDALAVAEPVGCFNRAEVEL